MTGYNIIRITETICYQADTEEEAIEQMNLFAERDRPDKFRIEDNKVESNGDEQ